MRIDGQVNMWRFKRLLFVIFVTTRRSGSEKQSAVLMLIDQKLFALAGTMVAPHFFKV